MEFVGTFQLTSPYPAQDDTRAVADGRACWKDFVAPKVQGDSKLYDDSEVATWYPSSVQIARGQTTAYCVLRADPKTASSVYLVGSLVAGTYKGTE